MSDTKRSRAQSNTSRARIFPAAKEGRIFCMFVVVIVCLVGGTVAFRIAGGTSSSADQSTVVPAVSSTLQINENHRPAAQTHTQPIDNQPSSPGARSSSTIPSSKVTCDESKRTLAEQQRDKSTASENDYHAQQVSLIESTGLVTRFVSPVTYAEEIDHENSRHNNQLSLIGQTFIESLHAAHCDQP